MGFEFLQNLFCTVKGNAPTAHEGNTVLLQESTGALLDRVETLKGFRVNDVLRTEFANNRFRRKATIVTDLEIRFLENRRAGPLTKVKMDDHKFFGQRDFGGFRSRREKVRLHACTFS